MSVLNNAVALLLADEAGGAGGYEISRSLRFNSSDSAYLSKSFSTTGNRKKWTWAGWVKRSNVSSGTQMVFECYNGSNDSQCFNINFGENIVIGGYSVLWLTTEQKLRDPSAWYHLLLAVDTTQATADNRIRLFINGVQVTAFSSRVNPSPSQDLAVNQNATHYIGTRNASSFYLNAYLADIYFLDGLTPGTTTRVVNGVTETILTDFGEFDADTGVWNPIAYTGTYPGNSFHLDFADNSTAAALGTDTSGNGNDWTVNNIVAQDIIGHSVYFDGTGDRITASNSNLALGSADFTVEMYFKKDSTSSQQTLLGYTSNSPLFEFDGNQLRWMDQSSYSPTLTAGKWYHAAWTRQGSTGRIFLDGALIATVSYSVNLANSSIAIGSRADGSAAFKGWISNLRVVVGTALYTSSFSIPTLPLTAVTNTKLLTCQSATIVDNGPLSVSLTTVGNTVVSSDSPPTPTADSLVDVPTNGTETDTGLGGEVRGNYATWLPTYGSTGTFSNGNLDVTTASSNAAAIPTSIFPASGKWYWEVLIANYAGRSDSLRVGICNTLGVATGLGTNANTWCFLGDGRLFHNNSSSSYGVSVVTGDIVNVALDLDAGKIWYGKNGTWMASGSPATGANPSQTFTANQSMSPAVASGIGSPAYTLNAGARSFAYTAPSGFKALCTANLPAPVVTKPSEYMDVVTYTGDGASSRTISGLNFSPELIWTKSRSNGYNHNVQDIVRGFTTGKKLGTNLTQAEGDPAELADTNGYVSSQTSDGYVISIASGGSGLNMNASSLTYAAWCWDAGSSTVSNTDGSITSSVRANPSAGFSIVTYTGTGSAATVGHGLGVTPAFIIVKCRNAGFATNWVVWSNQFASLTNNFLRLDTTGSIGTVTNYWGSAAPTSAVFGVAGGGYDNNHNTLNHVAYCFAPVAGYSSMSSFVANGSSDNAFVYTGFRPRWIILKCSSTTSSWAIHDSSRGTYNVIGPYLLADTSGAEASVGQIDFLSNGFKLRNSGFGSGQTWIYAAFAESPFQYARAR